MLCCVSDIRKWKKGRVPWPRTLVLPREQHPSPPSMYRPACVRAPTNGESPCNPTGEVSRDHFVCTPSQWETALHCNAVSHWLGAYTKWSLGKWSLGEAGVVVGLDVSKFFYLPNFRKFCWFENRLQDVTISDLMWYGPWVTRHANKLSHQFIIDSFPSRFLKRSWVLVNWTPKNKPVKFWFTVNPQT